MKRCKLCLMPETRPGIQFNEEGVCYPCLNHKKGLKTNWFERWDELIELCDNFRKDLSKDYYYDCIVCISGGKDSHFITYIFKEILKMNPLGIMIDNTSWTNTGRKNFYNISSEFGIDIITYTYNMKDMKEKVYNGFIEKCNPTAYWDYILYTTPFELARKFGIDLIIWGENTSYETGGLFWEETPDAHILLTNPNDYPDITAIFTSYYVPWDRQNNLKIAKEYGFKTLEDTKEWKRNNMKGFEFEQIDTIGYMVNQFGKFIKFGFSNMTELCSDAIRKGYMTREEGMKKVQEMDWLVDPLMIKDFCESIDISEEIFWNVIDHFANKELLEKREDGWWHVKDEM